MKVTKLAPAMGAEITGIDLGSSDFSNNLIGEIRAVWLEHGMVVLRGQNLTPQQQLELARALASPTSILSSKASTAFPKSPPS